MEGETANCVSVDSSRPEDRRAPQACPWKSLGPAATTIEIVNLTPPCRGCKASYRSEVQVYALPPTSHPGRQFSLRKGLLMRHNTLSIILRAALAIFSGDPVGDELPGDYKLKRCCIRSIPVARRLSPYAGLIADSAGNLYGTTYNGGTYNAGTVFEVESARPGRRLDTEGAAQLQFQWF